MKTKHWMILLGIVLVVCGGLSLWLLRPGQTAARAEVWSEGKLLKTLSLTQDQTLTIQTDLGKNVITVRSGAVAVTEADCPGGDCMARGFCSGGAQIVCLPHRLVIRFPAQTDQDSISQ